MSSGITAYPNRRAFIGGSNARIIMGDEEAALLRLWREKRGEIEPEDLSLITSWSGVPPGRQYWTGKPRAEKTSHYLAQTFVFKHQEFLRDLSLRIWFQGKEAWY
jgi:hypothetical protein